MSGKELLIRLLEFQMLAVQHRSGMRLAGTARLGVPLKGLKRSQIEPIRDLCYSGEETSQGIL
jgi:hypothetical protein